MYTTWRSASELPVEKLKSSSVFGPIQPIIDLMIKDGGQTIRKRNPRLSEAQSITKFLEGQDGQALYEIGRSLPAGARFESNPKAVRNALGLIRTGVINKSYDFTTTPMVMKLSGLLVAAVRKS
jgi:hypothetical protein